MGIIVNLIGFLPPPRFDTPPTPFTHVTIEEAPASTGPWTQIDAQTIPNPDVDPQHPAPRNFTTSNATLTVGFYRVRFFDDFAGSSEWSDPMRNPPALILPPSADEVRNMSPLLRKKYPLPPADDYSISDLHVLVAEAIATVQANTWRTIDPTLGCSAAEGYVCEVVPDALVPIAFQAIIRMAERIKVTTDPAFAEQVATGRRLRGFSAGPYSESYFAPGEFARRGAQTGRPAMDQDDALDAALWALATEDARDYFVWRATGVAPPTGVAVAFDYRRESLGYSGASSGWWGGGLGRGPDGF